MERSSSGCIPTPDVYKRQVIDSTAGKGEEELELIHRFHKKGIPYLIVYNKIDLLSTEKIKDLAMSVRAGEVLDVYKRQPLRRLC